VKRSDRILNDALSDERPDLSDALAEGDSMMRCHFAATVGNVFVALSPQNLRDE